MPSPKNGWRNLFPQGLTSPSDEKPTAQHLDADPIAAKGLGSQKRNNKQSLDYVLRTGLAGGLAGCAVRPSPSIHIVSLHTQQSPRPKPSSVLSTGSKFYSKPRTLSSQNTPALGSASSPPCVTSTAKTACADSFVGTLQPSSASSRTPPSNS